MAVSLVPYPSAFLYGGLKWLGWHILNRFGIVDCRKDFVVRKFVPPFEQMEGYSENRPHNDLEDIKNRLGCRENFEWTMSILLNVNERSRNREERQHDKLEAMKRTTLLFKEFSHFGELGIL